MLPAPRKPTPVTIWAAIRVGSTVLPKIGIRPSPVNKHEPAPMSAIVRIPAAWPLISRSVPSARPITSATKTRKARSNSPESGVLSAPAGTTSGPVLRAGLVLRAWLVGKLGEVQAVHEVAEHCEPLLVDHSLHRVLAGFGLDGLGGDAGGMRRSASCAFMTTRCVAVGMWTRMLSTDTSMRFFTLGSILPFGPRQPS